MIPIARLRANSRWLRSWLRLATGPMRSAVAEYRISDRAKLVLIDIYDFTDDKFGRYQADAYHAGFERTFGLIADFPGIGRSADELLPGLRRFRFQSHTIFYSFENDQVLIRTIVHVKQDLRSDLFE